MDFLKEAEAAMGGGNSKGGKHGSADLLKKAGSYMLSHHSGASSQAPAAGAPPGAAPSAGSGNYKEVYGSAQILYQGLQDKLHGKESNVDDHHLAEAAANVLRAAEHAGFAKDSQYQEYFNKAEKYLHNYGQPRGSAAPPAAFPPADQRQQ